jgi:hypothetical protein
MQKQYFKNIYEVRQKKGVQYSPCLVSPVMMMSSDSSDPNFGIKILVFVSFSILTKMKKF